MECTAGQEHRVHRTAGEQGSGGLKYGQLQGRPGVRGMSLGQVLETRLRADIERWGLIASRGVCGPEL